MVGLGILTPNPRIVCLAMLLVTSFECWSIQNDSMSVNALQVREKDCDSGDFVATVRSAIAAARPLGVKVIVNDRVDVALAAGADGIHVGQSDIPCDLVRVPTLSNLHSRCIF